MRIRFFSSIRFTNTTLGIMLTACILLLRLADPVPLKRLDLLMADWRFQLRGAVPPGPEVVIAALDEKSLDDPDLGIWPWSYDMQAKLIDQLTAYGAKSIGYDVVFSASDTRSGIEQLQDIRNWLTAEEDDRYSELATFVDNKIAEADHNQIFADALARSSRTILGYFFHWYPDDIGHLREADMQAYLQNIRNSKYNAPITASGVNLKTLSLPTGYAVESSIRPLSDAAWGAGFFNSYPDPDGVHRRYRLIVKYRDWIGLENEPDYLFAPLGLRTLERYLQDGDVRANTVIWAGPNGVTHVGIHSPKGKYILPTNREGQMLINHLGPSDSTPLFPRFSAVDIIKGNHSAAPPEAFRDKIILVGATAIGLVDSYATPFNPSFPGVELHATMIDNILRGDFLVDPWWGPLYTIGFIFFVGVLLTCLGPRLPALWTHLLAATLLLGSLVLNYVFFDVQGWALSAVYPPLATIVLWAGLTAWEYMGEQQEKHFLRKAFTHYLSPQLIEEMVQTKTQPQLGGSSGIRTAYFTDIASFSTFSEQLSPTQLVAILNEYLGAMTDILMQQGGTLDRYDGDGIVAFFGAPMPLEDHAMRALRTALGMQQKLAELRAKWHAEGDQWPELVKQMRMRIGINSGEFVTGNMGSALRMNYSMHGDMVNTAARLETSAKQYGIYLHSTAKTLDLAGPDAFEWRVIDKAIFVGKTEPLETVEVLAFKGQLSEEQRQLQGLYQQGIELYRQQQWEEAKAAFRASDKFEDHFPNRPTTPSRVYLERCDYFIAHPPAADWDGSWALTSK